MIDKIRAASKPPQILRKTIVEKGKGSDLSAKEENRLRIEKMKKLYGLYKQFQEAEEKEAAENKRADEPPVNSSLPEVRSPMKNIDVKMIPKVL